MKMKTTVGDTSVYGVQKMVADPTGTFLFMEFGSNTKPNDKSIETLDEALANKDAVVGVGAACLRPDICDFKRIDPTKTGDH